MRKIKPKEVQTFLHSTVPVDERSSTPFARAVLIASSWYSDPELAIWFTAPQPLLDGWTPLQLLGCGRANQLESAVIALNESVYL